MEKFIANFSNYKWFRWIVNNPKIFYTYTMVFLIISFIVNMTFSIYYEKPIKNYTSMYPIMNIKDEKIQLDYEKTKEKMKKTVNELETMKKKRDQGLLTKTDSIRIEYLYNQYQSLKHELQKN
ncbi:hypothetical protein [Vaginella massiliensis]|uniref:hypothetical protein n=1 Tax=Vaginella massiliensis TaxID=1816680 RepID=UPI0008395F46|nr:hypothetical protein [Vaginella massiliensis]